MDFIILGLRTRHKRLVNLVDAALRLPCRGFRVGGEALGDLWAGLVVHLKMNFVSKCTISNSQKYSPWLPKGKDKPLDPWMQSKLLSCSPPQTGSPCWWSPRNTITQDWLWRRKVLFPHLVVVGEPPLVCGYSVDQLVSFRLPRWRLEKGHFKFQIF